MSDYTSSEAREKFAVNIIRLRNEKKLSIYKVSKETGLGYSFLREMEIGKRSPSLDTVDKLAKYYEVEVYELFK